LTMRQAHCIGRYISLAQRPYQSFALGRVRAFAGVHDAVLSPADGPAFQLPEGVVVGVHKLPIIEHCEGPPNRINDLEGAWCPAALPAGTGLTSRQPRYLKIVCNVRSWRNADATQPRDP